MLFGLKISSRFLKIKNYINLINLITLSESNGGVIGFGKGANSSSTLSCISIQDSMAELQIMNLKKISFKEIKGP